MWLYTEAKRIGCIAPDAVWYLFGSALHIFEHAGDIDILVLAARGKSPAGRVGGRHGCRCKANQRRPCQSIAEEGQRSRCACAARNPKGARGLRPLAVFLVVVNDQSLTSSSCLASERSSLARDRARLLPRTASG